LRFKLKTEKYTRKLKLLFSRNNINFY
jgi:hypothetical protein